MTRRKRSLSTALFFSPESRNRIKYLGGINYSVIHKSIPQVKSYVVKYYSPTITHGKTFVYDFFHLVNRLYTVIHKTQKS